MKPDKIFHISENGEIDIFKPRPSPSRFKKLDADVVFGISGKLLHNYLLPRDCPRVTYYAGNETSQADRETFLQTSADSVIAIESGWIPTIEKSILFCYEFDGETFSMIDECADYYVSFEAVKPLNIRRIDNILEELFKRKNLELKILPELWTIADKVVKSSLNFSLIRTRNATAKQVSIYFAT